MASKKLIIYVTETDNHKLVGIELNDISKDEAVVILNRCLNKLLHEYEFQAEILTNKRKG
jgi:hypothetical protein